MIDRFGRRIDYLRISVTDRCNLRCRYCMPPDGPTLVPHAEILRFEEIVEVARVAVEMGVTKLRLTGGEPLVRREIEKLVRMLAQLPGVRDLAMTTNGTLLAKHAKALALAGLHRVNVSLDAIDPQRYAAITANGDVRDVLAGIEAACRAGLHPIKLNCVVGGDSDPHDAQDVAKFARTHGLQVRFIPQMDLARGRFGLVQGGTGGDCPRCNRLRLSADGQIRPCLFSDLGYSVRELGAAEALRRAVEAKPASGSACTSRSISAIGG